MNLLFSIDRMHARKLPRISEPSFDKDYYDYGNKSSYKSKLKYSSYRDHRRSISPDNRSSPRDRDRDRKYARMRDRDRDHRDRDHRDHRDRERDRESYYSKYSRSKDDRDRDSYRDRSPNKDHRSKWESSRDSKSSRLEKESERTSSTTGEIDIKSVGDWAEHLSSSGKKYYYNCITEVSQWEKPKEWLEYERSLSLGDR